MRTFRVRAVGAASSAVVLALVVLSSCGGGATDSGQTGDPTTTGTAERTATSAGPVDVEYTVGEPFDLLAGPHRGGKRRFDVNVDGPQGVPFAMIRFDPAGSVTAAEADDVPGAAVEVGPAGCVPSNLDVAGATGERCFDDDGGIAVVVVPDVGSFRIIVPCGSTEDLDAMLAAVDLVDVADLAPEGDEELPRDGPLLQPCPDQPPRS